MFFVQSEVEERQLCSAAGPRPPHPPPPPPVVCCQQCARLAPVQAVAIMTARACQTDFETRIICSLSLSTECQQPTKPHVHAGDVAETRWVQPTPSSLSGRPSHLAAPIPGTLSLSAAPACLRHTSSYSLASLATSLGCSTVASCLWHSLTSQHFNLILSFPIPMLCFIARVSSTVGRAPLLSVLLDSAESGAHGGTLAWQGGGRRPCRGCLDEVSHPGIVYSARPGGGGVGRS